MKILTTIFLICASALRALTEAGSPADAATNAVVITTDYINRLAEEARTNNPALRAADSRVRSATANVGSVRTWQDPMAMHNDTLRTDRRRLGSAHDRTLHHS